MNPGERLHAVGDVHLLEFQHLLRQGMDPGGVMDVDFFKARDCDADQWARTAKEAGMGYILFLAKHHDGFCLWDTETTDRKVTRAPWGVMCWRR